MKQLVLTAALLLSCLAGFAQREIYPVDWKSIKKTVAKDPDRVRDIVVRLSAPTLDSTLTYSDRILGFYGQSLLTNDSESGLVREAVKLYSNKDFAGALGKAEQVLEINPLNIRALDRAARSVFYLVEAGDTTHTKDEVSVYLNRSMRLLNTIALTGYGNKEHPFCVTSVADEYDFMQIYLDLYEYTEQALIGKCDVFTLKEKSEYYSEEKIWFDASRPLEILSNALFR